jgi:uncharacterized protein (UPF0276 family)
MKLAINYSPASAELYRKGAITIDAFKVPDWPNLVAEASAICTPAVHFSLQAGSGKLAQSDWKLIDKLLATTATPYVNLHLDAHKNDFPGIPLDTTEAAHKELVFERLLQDTMAVVSRYGAERVIAENVPYKGGDGDYLRPCGEPDLIRRVVEQAGCGLLLDISHARLSAHYLGIPETEYLAQLPTQRIREMHIAGVHTLPDGLQDHLSMLEDDWNRLAWVLERIQRKEWSQPWMLAFEYGGVGSIFAWRSDAAVIAEQVPRLYAMVHIIKNT